MNPEELPLRDLHLPPAIDWWPPAPGWWIVIVTLTLLLLFFAWRYLRRFRRNAARRQALRDLERLQRRYAESGDAVHLAAGLSALLRRAMLAYAPRQEVAGLTGNAWLAWLDRGLEGHPFSAGPGRLLAELPYRRSPVRDVDAASLVHAVEHRLRTPLPETIS